METNTMKVCDIIQRLTDSYDPNAELFIVWWDQQNFRNPHDPMNTSNEPWVELWNAVVHKIDNDEPDALNDMYDVIQGIINDTAHP